MALSRFSSKRFNDIRFDDGGGGSPAPSKYSDKFIDAVTKDIDDPTYVITSDPVGNGYQFPGAPFDGSIEVVGGAGYVHAPAAGVYSNFIQIPDLSISTSRRIICDLNIPEHPLPPAAPFPQSGFQFVAVDNAINGFIFGVQYDKFDGAGLNQFQLRIIKIEGGTTTTPLGSITYTGTVNTDLPFIMDMDDTNVRVSFGDEVIVAAHGFGVLPVLQILQPLIRRNDPSPSPASVSMQLKEVYPWL